MRVDDFAPLFAIIFLAAVCASAWVWIIAPTAAAMGVAIP